jgi:hypothetical protein
MKLELFLESYISGGKRVPLNLIGVVGLKAQWSGIKSENLILTSVHYHIS